MTKATINLTGSLVVEEIDFFLAAYPEGHPYRAALSHPEQRRKLVSWVLSRVPNRYALLQDSQGRPIYPDFQSASLEKRLKVEEIIKTGIEEILAKR
ncbi:hypothetical protein [Oscillatoria sp. FACHB-1406]|uniref:hypothetical protein n=1 Tax=Oscillatoria sp. FACHB-1406 TaxID=2692846 RepID=UPI00168A1768|nr:hypothetical protein [Oscillatoria sp. FACHB-1406]MBD2577491.1 hypothetical protein [Oscillatoria sp. FACHB-1406]